jgi:hypothetical protein
MTDPPPVRRQCHHIKDNGEQCKKNALPGRTYCNMESHRRAALLRTRVKNFGRRWWPVFIGVFTLAVGIPSLYSYFTRITVVPAGTIRAHEPMGTIFNVFNNGIFDLHKVRQECEVSFPKYGKIVVDHNTASFVLGDLPAGTYKSLDCEHAVRGFPGAASLEISINFHSPLWPFQRTKHSLFQSEQADDGTWVWKAQ